MEGFNNKIRWLIEQAYGFRDSKYFKLKIYQLPEISSVKELQFMAKIVEETNFERKRVAVYGKNIEETKILHREGALQE